MEMLFDLLGSELSAYKEWKEWISIIAQEKNRSHMKISRIICHDDTMMRSKEGIVRMD